MEQIKKTNYLLSSIKVSKEYILFIYSLLTLVQHTFLKKSLTAIDTFQTEISFSVFTYCLSR